jgi:hypothetical protein
MVSLPPIVWISRDDKTEYGMLGSIKAFSIHSTTVRSRLDPRLPDCKGVQYQSEEFRDLGDAKARAEDLREQWLKDLQTPYEGQLKQVS